jgi:putative transposase
VACGSGILPRPLKAKDGVGRLWERHPAANRIKMNCDSLPTLMHSLKSYTAKQINAVLNRKGQLWQDQYHEHAIRKDEVLTEIVNYMLHNPVRAGLVKGLHDYPFWYCRWAV